MKNIETLFRFIIFILALTFLNSCQDEQPEDIYKILEEKGRITTFPLNIVLASNLSGENFPEDLKSLAAISPGQCKTLPVAGLLRLGPDQYYTYNAVSTITLGPDDKDEKSITRSVITQVNGYLAKTTLKDFDSLRAPGRTEFSSQVLATEYVRSTTDSIFVYSAAPTASNLTVMGGRSFPVFTDAVALRRKIDEMICNRQVSVSIIYTPSPTGATIAGGNVPAPAVGMFAGDTCIGTSKFEKLNDGKGNLFVGKLIEENSKSCGFSFPTGVAGDTCIGKSRYQRLHNGRGGFTLGSLVERNSITCGFTYPTGLAGDSCYNGSKYQKMHDGKGGFVLGNIIEKNSRACGFKPPVVVAPVPVPVPAKTVVATPPAKKTVTAPPVAKPVTPPVTRPVTNQVVTKPVTTPPVTRQVTKAPVVTSTPPATKRVLTTRQTVPTDELPDAGTTPKSTAASDRRCAKTSEAVCEQDLTGNYTGRRVQYCYNAAGKVVRTIVVAKCDGDCRCIGR